ncbi:MAG: glycine zipper 2TM domain-containing protein, partial [Pseudomonadota bacterium]
KRGNGTTGLIVGAAGGALLGRAIDTRGDRTVGTLLGGALGAVIGREIDRGSARCR